MTPEEQNILETQLQEKLGFSVDEFKDDSEPNYIANREQNEVNVMESELESEFGSSEPEPEIKKQVVDEKEKPPKIDKNKIEPEFHKGVNSLEISAESENSLTADIAKDVMRGITEIPSALAGGLIDAANGLIATIDDLGNSLDEAVGIDTSEEAQGKLIQVPNPFESKDKDSTTGKLVQKAVTFIGGFIATSKLKPFKAFQPAKTSGKIAKATAQSAVTDFSFMETADAKEALLGDLLSDVPALEKIIPEFMKTQPGDTSMDRRLKRTLEGVGFGLAIEPLVMALRALKQTRIVKELLNKPAMKDSSESLTKENFSIIGDSNADSLILKNVKSSLKETGGIKAKDVLKKTDTESNINFARIDSDEDIKTVLKNMESANASDINKSKRGKISHKQTKLNAEQQNAWKILSERRTGDALNAEQSLAVRNAWVQSGTKLKEVAEEVVKNPSAANLFAFRKMVTVHDAIQKHALSARAEAGRALNSWQIPSGGNAEIAKGLEQILEQSGGSKVAINMAKRIKAFADNGMEVQMSKFIEQSTLSKTMDGVAQAWINGLLSAPTTHIVNAMSNWSVAGMQVYERATASHISKVLGTEDGVVFGEAITQVHGLVQGIKETLAISAKGRTAIKDSVVSVVKGKMKNAKEILKANADEFGGTFKTAASGESQFGKTNKIDLPRVGAFSSETWKVSSDTWVGKGLDGLDNFTQLPGRMLNTGDEFFKSIGYRMELNAQALRKATTEFKEGVITQGDIKKRAAEIVQNPPENIKLASIDAATYQTFTNTTDWLPKQLADKIQQFPVLGRLVLPFKRTPVNILAFSLERTPLAPVVKAFREDVRAGGARRDVALAKISTGSFIMLAAMDLRLNGQITGQGPTRSGERGLYNRMGKQKYSVNIDGRNFAYNRADPLGMTVGLSADIVEIITNSQAADKEIEDLIVTATLAVAKNLTSKTYMQGISKLFDAVSSPDRYGQSYFDSLASSLVPSGVAAITRSIDPFLRSAQGMADSIKKRSPWWSDELPHHRDIWGRKVSFESGLGKAYDFISPFYSRVENPEPIDTELERLGFFPTNPKHETVFGNVTINLRKHPHAYERYVELAGNEIKHPTFGLGLKDFLNDVIQDKNVMSGIYNSSFYTDGPDGSRANFIEKYINEYRGLAKGQLLKEFPKLRGEVEHESLKSGAINSMLILN